MWDEVQATFNRVLGEGVADAETAQVALTPARRMATPADFVGAALFLSGEASDYVVGQTLNVDGGFNMD